MCLVCLNTMKSNFLPVYQLTRGEIVESIHHGAVAVVNNTGELIASFGDPQAVVFLRSTAKPIQAIPFVEQGGPEHFSLTKKELALICASHIGTDAHAATAASIQAKGGFLESDLQCGLHPPFDKETWETMLIRGDSITQNRHDCSGKHSGMLSFARMNDWSIGDYLDQDHPVQEHILYAFSGMSSVPHEEIVIGIDGCTAPNFAVPLYNGALALARLCNPSHLHSERIEACHTIFEAMTTHPEMVAGEGEFDTRLMQVTKGRIVSKGGAEGYQGIGIKGKNGESWGITIKIADGGARSTVRPAVAMEVLRQLDALTPEELADLNKFGPVLPVHNWRKLVIGESSPVFELEFGS